MIKMNGMIATDVNNDFIQQLIEINQRMDNAQTTVDWEVVTEMFAETENQIESMIEVLDGVLPAIHDLLVYTGERLV